MKVHRRVAVLVAVAAAVWPTVAHAWAQDVSSDEVERWGCFELSLEGPKGGNPFVDVKLSARFERAGRRFEPEGFYDGDGVWRVRFMPDELGRWSYTTRSNRKELDGVRGTFTCVAPTGENHGPVSIRDTFYFAYADGTPYHQFGTTCYAWVHQGERMEQQTLKTLAGSPFNKLRMCVFPKSYAYNQNEPELYPFEGKPLTDWDFTRFNPEFFRHFERRVRDLQPLGIEADVILYHTYDRWGFESMDARDDDRFIRYLVARLAAYRNVWWSLANEFDIMPDKKESDWDRFFQIIRDADPYGRFRGIHNCRVWYDHTKPWVTHASLQTSDMAGGLEYRRRYQKPVIYDECKYEGNIPQGWGNLTPIQMVRRFWQGTLSGCYVGHGETYLHPQDLLWWAKGGVLRGESPARIAYLKELMTRAPPFHELEPMAEEKGSYILGKPGEYYLVYFAAPKTISLDLTGQRPYKIDVVDPWEMKTTAAGTASAGRYTFSASRPDQVFRFTPYEPGQRIRPEAKASAPVTHGSAPLEVKFRAAGDLPCRWDFGDGNSSTEARPSHVYKNSGRYVAALTVTDPAGLSSTTWLSINVLPAAPTDLSRYRSWPGSHSGLVFLWKSDREENKILDADGATLRSCRVKSRGDAKIGRRGEMEIGSGSFLADGVDEPLLEACRLTNQLAIEAVVTTRALDQAGPARIITFSKDHTHRNFTLGQENGHLVLRLRTPSTGPNGLSPQVTLCDVEAGKPMHVIASFYSGNVYCYVDGKLTLASSDVRGDFSNWEPCQLAFGDEIVGKRSWRGQLEGVAIYSRFIGPEEAAVKYALYRQRLRK